MMLNIQNHQGLLVVNGRVLKGFIAACASTGFLLIGYDNGIMGGLVNNTTFLNTFALDIDRDAKTIGTIVAIYDIGCFFGALSSAFCGDRFGRRLMILAGSIWMLVGAILQASANCTSVLIVGRVVSGIGMGAINSAIPIIQAETSPPISRGRSVCIQLSTLNLGIMLAYWIDYAFSKCKAEATWYWRAPVALQLVWILSLISLTICIPESPRYLILHSFDTEAIAILARLGNGSEDDHHIRRQFEEIKQSITCSRQLGTGRWSEVFQAGRSGTRRRIMIACGIQAAQQLGGINALIYYSGIIFEQSLQMPNNASSLLSGFLYTWFFIASFIPYFLIDRVGRRKLLLSTIFGMALCFSVVAGLIKKIESVPSRSTETLGLVAAASIFLYLGLFTIGFQAVVWVIPTEILPLRLRAKGSSLSTAINWILNYTVVQITPIAIQKIGWKLYLVFALLNASFLLPIYFFLPETAKRSLESIELLFSDLGSSSDATVVLATGLDGQPSTPAGKGQNISIAWGERLSSPQ